MAPITVLRAGDLARGVRIQLPEASLSRALAWRLTEESGEAHEEAFAAVKLQRIEEHEHAGRHVHAFLLPLPTELGEGYHRLAILEGEALLGQGTIAVVPQRCYLPPLLEAGGRVWGTTVQLYGLRSARNAGMGDFSDLRACAEEWGSAAAHRRTNPLHGLARDPATRAHKPLQPYSSSLSSTSRRCRLRERDAHERLRRDGARMEPLRSASGRLAASPSEARVFERLYPLPQEAPGGATSARRRHRIRDALGRRCPPRAHEALEIHFGVPWRQWPEASPDPGSGAARASRDEHPDKVGLHEYLQWQADKQLAAVQARCESLGMAVGLYADLAISIGPDGSEAWANQASTRSA